MKEHTESINKMLLKMLFHYLYKLAIGEKQGRRRVTQCMYVAFLFIFLKTFVCKTTVRKIC